MLWDTTISPVACEATHDKEPLLPPTAKGVFIPQVQRAEQACRTACTVTHFVCNDNNNADSRKHPIRTFADANATVDAMNKLTDAMGGANTEVIVDTERWHELPLMLASAEQAMALEKCKKFSVARNCLRPGR